jgi:hypothetical protein
MATAATTKYVATMGGTYGMINPSIIIIGKSLRIHDPAVQVGNARTSAAGLVEFVIESKPSPVPNHAMDYKE